ncbi:LAMI_0H04566g1_1 [Lachancea mirantina]|uniref:LAMI_0H04566g1_1 n=1 Tax=Lachancea mirantina TaxID=1230905 RepID=A0A1G4KEM2_9SACH|nr:LAMI_0H04566g1_1 [Lachancea mirantina]
MALVVEKSVFSSGGKTSVQLSPDGNHLFAVNKHGLTKILPLNAPDEEPEVLEICSNPTSLSPLSPTSCIVTSLKGDVHMYGLQEGDYKLLHRSTLPERDCALAHNGKMAVIAGDDLEIAVLDLSQDAKRGKMQTEDQVSNVTYNGVMSILALSFVNGDVQFLSMASAEPHHIHKLEKYLAPRFFNDDFDSQANGDSAQTNDEYEDPEYCDDNRISTKVEWHPRGQHLAMPCNDKSVKIFNIGEYSLMRSLTSPVASKSLFTDLKYSPQSGEFLAAIDLNNHLVVWRVETGDVAFSKDLGYKTTNLCWRLQPDDHLDIILGTWAGDIVTIKNVAKKSPQVIDQLGGLFVSSDEEESGFEATKALNGKAENNDNEEGSRNSQNLFTDEEDVAAKGTRFHYDDDNFIDDDDGAGYVNPKKRKKDHALPTLVPTTVSTRNTKFRYRPFSPGATPFGTSDRRYLTMNTIGYAWCVRGEEGYASSHNTITISFFDLSRFKEYHFEDLTGYDVCSLTENGALFAQSKLGILHYRQHNQFTANWTKKIPLQESERITAIAATAEKMIVGTSFGYLRTFNSYGVALGIEKMSPVVAVAAQGYRIFCVHFSPYHGLSYSLFEQHPDTGDHFFAKESSLPLTLPSEIDNGDEFGETFPNFSPLGLKSVFFSTYGDPCVFGADDVLLVLSKWRNTVQTKWIPLMDSSFEVWRRSGGKNVDDVRVWPLGLTHHILSHILVKGRNAWPDFPLPLPSEMEVRIPVIVKEKEAASQPDNAEDVNLPSDVVAEEEFLRSRILGELLADTLEHDGQLYGDEDRVLNALAGAYDKSLLRLFASACSSQDVGKASSLAKELKQDKALTAAIKIAERAELMTLVDKVRAMQEARFEEQLNSRG